MSEANNLATKFRCGTSTVEILQGDILAPGVEVDAVVSTDDNYLTMASGVAGLLRKEAGGEYMLKAQDQCPVKAGTVVVTAPHGLVRHLPDLKYVLHGTVIDYDSADWPLEQLVSQTTANCLEKAQDLGLVSILFPALATGAGRLSMQACARQMCNAIKAYLAQERPLKSICIILFFPPKGAIDPSKLAELRDRNQRFINEANLVLGIPYDPVLNVRQARDFYGRDDLLEQLEEIIAGKQDDEGGKRHVIILGGPRTGKSGLLDQLTFRAQLPQSTLSQGRRVVRVTFGRVHENTPVSFIYHKFLRALGQGEDDESMQDDIKKALADPDINCDHFLSFLEEHSDRYPEVVLLIDRIPRLLQMEPTDPTGRSDVGTIWGDLDRLQQRVRFVYTARYDDQYRKLLHERLERYTVSYRHIRVIWLKCVSKQQRSNWVNALWQRYLGRNATTNEHEFFEREAGYHPYLISLAGYALIDALKSESPVNPTRQSDSVSTLQRFFQAARNALEAPRQAFFHELMSTCLDPEDRFELSTLANATAMESERESLIPEAAAGDAKAIQRLAELAAAGDPRQALHRDRLQRLEAQGYLVNAAEPRTAAFMSDSFATWVAEYYGVGRRKDEYAAPQHAVISLLGPEREPGSDRMLITTFFRKRGAKIVTAKTPIQHKDVFMEGFDRLVRHVLHPTLYPDCGEFSSLEQVGDFILNCFTTGRIRSHFKDLPVNSTIALEVDDRLRDIPWELMLEAVYAGEIPVRIGRSIVSQGQPADINPPVRGNGKVRALLIGDPTDDLAEARAEVENLTRLLQDDGRFTVDGERDVLIGSQACRLLHLLNRLRSGEYGLIHYSGHSVFEDDQSAWLLKDGKINTFDLTSSLRNAPPVLVFSSSCESAEAGEPRPIKYEDQTFDLPSAFLRAGVEAYVGTLWEVEASAARQFAEAFYEALLLQGHCLGECLRLAKMRSKELRDRINWMAFILYGEPRTKPGDLFPALRKQKESE